MPTYGNINGAQKEIKPWYTNINGAQTLLKNLHGNIGGVQKTLYSAQKYYWWKRYNVNSWTQESFSTYSQHEQGSMAFNAFWSGSYCFSSYNFNVNTGQYTLSGLKQITWVETDRDESAIQYVLASNCQMTYTAWPEYLDSTNNKRQLYRISQGWGVHREGVFSGYVVTPYCWYAKPVGHVTSYTLVKETNASAHPHSGYAGYPNSENSDDYWTYDGYYWEYEGYHE